MSAPTTTLIATGGHEPDDSRPRPTRRQLLARGAVVASVLLIAVMWVYAFVLADDKPLAELDDASWSQRAAEICDVRNDLLDANAEVAIAGSDGTPQDVGAAVTKATDVIEDALDEVLAVRPTSARDVGLVDRWEGLYRTYISDRRAVEARLLAGEAVELNETTINGSPVSLTIGDFVKHNRMESCRVPFGR